MVSVIIPIYNVEQYLAECVDSVLAQTYTDIEVILVDDGSTDNSGAICDDYAARDRRVIVIHKKNGGLSDARNAGLNIAKGEYILFVDADDYIDSSLVEITTEEMNKGNDMVAFRFYHVQQEGNLTKGESFIAGEWSLDSSEKRTRFYANILLKYRIGWEACFRMFRRELIKKMNLRFEDNRRIFAEDLYFSICYCLEARRIACLDRNMYYYRVRYDSIMGKENARLNVDRMNELGKCVQAFFVQHKASKELIEELPLIHFYAIHGVANKYKHYAGIRQIKLRKLMLAEIRDKDYFFTMLMKLHAYQKCLEDLYGKNEAMQIIKIADFWRTGNIPVFVVRTARCKIIKRR